MIVFKQISWVNFLSTGDNETTIQLDRSPTTLIVGHNGAGKSTLLDAISFALFNKPHRDITKPALVNSINKKNTVVSVEFEIGKHKFVIKRGIKPSVFEIWQNGTMINQSSTTRDYQKYLEQNILKLNHKSFHQIVVLGSSSFVPFMQLKSNHRREVIEDLLDINIFSKMNGILKENTARVKEDYKSITHEINIQTSKIDMQSKYITDMNKASESIKASKLVTMTKHLEEKEVLLAKSVLLNDQYETYDKITDKSLAAASDVKSVLGMDLNTEHVNLKALMKESKFYSTNTECPSCTQTIDETLRQSKIADITTAAKKRLDVKKTLEDKYREALAAVDDVTELLKKKRDLSSDIRMNDANINNVNTNIVTLNEEIKNSNTSNDDISNATVELEMLQQAKLALADRKYEINDEISYGIIIAEMLKDTGIKTKVIKEYLPVMNKLINNYLHILDFFVSFNLDENFDESIRSRHRDNFSYESFSEGEKSRIDLALMFTWRQIARMKNSTNTNLLILDETFDSSMDHDGVDNLMKILDTLDKGTNVFVISHKGEILESKFRSKIEFIKDRNFSKIK
mgnify:CR=1 FL=1|tara:strand:- start:977 stop:2692 length:1716 start_codon:yes stop_codon:yes gene_type:complete